MEEEHLDALHREILRIAYQLKEKSRIINVNILFESCCRELPNLWSEIDRAICDLYEMKYIVEGKQLFKKDILTNERRNKIYDYVLKNPGAHEREIRRIFQLGAYITHHHLALLEHFGFLRKITYTNKSVYFPTDFDKARETEILLLRHKTTNNIFDCIQKYGQIKMPELQSMLQIPDSTIRVLLKRLLEGGLIKRVEKNQSLYYVVADYKLQEGVVEVKRNK
ncbi:MAG: hypothetical protein HWN66_15575 [Candidatus Helarchaeota archaeon]|nr:hypothetical protein [Candidatus Helarchaeota archaeon]